MGLLQEVQGLTHKTADLLANLRRQQTRVTSMVDEYTLQRGQMGDSLDSVRKQLGDWLEVVSEVTQRLQAPLTQGPQSLDRHSEELAGSRAELGREVDLLVVQLQAVLPVVVGCGTALSQRFRQTVEALHQALEQRTRHIQELIHQRDEAGARARLLLEQLQQTRQSLLANADEVELRAQRLRKVLADQSGQLCAALESQAQHYEQKAQTVLEQGDQSATTVGSSEKTLFLETIIAELQTRLTGVDQALEEVRRCRERPEQLISEEIASLMKRWTDLVRNEQAPVPNIRRVHKKAKDLEIFDF